MKVQANVKLFYAGARRRPGDVFEMADEDVPNHTEQVTVVLDPEAAIKQAREAAAEKRRVRSVPMSELTASAAAPDVNQAAEAAAKKKG